jgi:putative peptide zinc metalloprotease protein
MDHGAPPAHELERRKQLKLRLRRDLIVEEQRYEGKLFYVVKDPVSLRYYRLKDNEYYLLQFFDGTHTLEDAQKAYEKEYRPDRLKLEDLESFGQQLFKAGLAQNESPRAGKQLYENRGKRKRMEWIQFFTNILYIKIPIFDPDVLLTKMLPYVRFIFTLWFFAISVGVMLAAILLVLTHFEIFRSKLPDYHIFFRFGTVVNLWVALGMVKIIHEFGHGLSCKRFGGEVHEMGALFLCLSPALYCNVSDAWTLPNKWHRIIISAAGIYVELIIAAIATFVWWNTPTQPFINNLALSLMIVCSISTVVFNANPLMRFDGYYVLADWLEIPNLREKSNRFLGNLVLEHCLGVEVQPEPYMALWRKVLFISYAIGSYIYRWVVTFSILWFMYSFLRPYKLEVISTLLALAALASMIGWPLYRLGRNIHRRGRLPDMKRWRVMVTSSVVIALILFVCLVPVPISRIRGVGVVEADSGDRNEATAKVFVRSRGILEDIRVRAGERVEKGDVMAVFRNPDLEVEKETAMVEASNYRHHLDLLLEEFRQTSGDPASRKTVEEQQRDTQSKLHVTETKLEAIDRVLNEEMVLRAPVSGIIGTAVKREEIGRLFDPTKGDVRPLFTIYQPKLLRVTLPLTTAEFDRLRVNLIPLTPKATATDKVLHSKKKVSFSCQGRLADALEQLSKQVAGLHLRLAPDQLALGNHPVEFAVEKRPLDVALPEFFTKYRIGYVIISDLVDEYDGWLQVAAGKERGSPEGGRPLAALPVTLRVHGRDTMTWKGRITRLPESEAKTVPLLLSNKANGPVAVRAEPAKKETARQSMAAGGDPLIPQTQQYLVHVEIIDPDEGIVPGALAQVKVRCQSETCITWLWRKINDLFDLGLW